MKDTFDVTVIGSGPGGYVAAIRACQLGLKVAVIEESHVGGTCLNWGCVPTKGLLQCARVFQVTRSGGDFGVQAENIGFDYGKMVSRKDMVVEQLRFGVEELLRSNGVVMVKGTGSFLDPNTIHVRGEETLTIKTGRAIIATGARPQSLPVPGMEEEAVLDSTGLLDLKECPQHLIIVGGGIIGVEFATLFNSLGRKVTIIEMLDTILTGIDPEISSMMRALLEERGVEIHTGARLTSVQSGRVCTVEVGGEERIIEGDRVVAAVGRKPNTRGLGLEGLGIRMDRDFVVVNDRMETSVDGIYAIGDVTGRLQLAHVASAQGITAAHNAAGDARRMSYAQVPACVYTSPEIAAVGLTEDEARQKGHKVKVGRFPVSMNSKAIIMGETEGLMKIITDEGTGEILGAHIMGPGAVDLIGEICAAMKLESTIEELADLIHPHPSVSEIMGEAAHDVAGLCIHKPKK